jgi:hypothetical protein
MSTNPSKQPVQMAPAALLAGRILCLVADEKISDVRKALDLVDYY